MRKTDFENPYADFIRKRITALRLEKNVSEYKMSYDLGKSKGYIQAISSQNALPSMDAFLDICAYFDITPSEFFDATAQRRKTYEELETLAEKLTDNDKKLVLDIVKRLSD